MVDDIEGCAAAVVELIRDRPRAEMLAERGRHRVREHFLLPRLLLNELSSARRDPVCGLAIGEQRPALLAGLAGRTYAFFSESCRNRLRRPEAFLGAALSPEAAR